MHFYSIPAISPTRGGRIAHAGLGRTLKGREAERLLQEDAEGRKPLAYHKPLIFSSHLGAPLAESALGSLHGVEGGTFEVKASGGAVKAYGLLWIYNNPALEGIDVLNHRHVCHVLRRLANEAREFGRLVLGGGYLLADYDRRLLMVFGASGDFGRLPDFMQREAFRRSGLMVHLAGYGNDRAQPGSANQQEASEWYLRHGIELD